MKDHLLGKADKESLNTVFFLKRDSRISFSPFHLLEPKHGSPYVLIFFDACFSYVVLFISTPVSYRFEVLKGIAVVASGLLQPVIAGPHLNVQKITILSKN